MLSCGERKSFPQTVQLDLGLSLLGHFVKLISSDSIMVKLIIEKAFLCFVTLSFSSSRNYRLMIPVESIIIVVFSAHNVIILRMNRPLNIHCVFSESWYDQSTAYTNV